MYIFKNAWISIKRNKGRNILIGIIILVIACAACITLAIKNTANNLIESYKYSYNKEATISFNRGNMMKNFDMSNRGGMDEAKNTFANIVHYTVEDIMSYADSKYVEDYFYTYQINLNGDSIEKVSSDFSFGERGNKRGEFQAQIPDFTLIGYNNINKMSEFIDGTYRMTNVTEDAWEKIFTENYVFINNELATLNEISLNDTITLTDNDNNKYEFIVIGIFEEKSTTDEIPTNMFSASANTIITSAEYLIKTFEENTGVQGTINPTFILKDYKDAEKLQNELYEKGLDENYILQTNEEEAESGVSSISNVSSFATSFLIITLLIGGIVLFVINMINIRERKYEIGVMRTIGVSKLKLTDNLYLNYL